MQRLRAFRRVCRFRSAMLLVVGLLAGVGMSAWAADAPDTVRTLTGCVNPATGTIGKLKPGTMPKTPCTGTEYRIRVSGGDITSVLPAAAGGLVGGSTNDAALLGIDFPALDGRYINEGDSVTWRGAWSAATAYVRGDAVYRAGSSYIALVANTNVVPANGATWQFIAQKGAQGASGLPGPGLRSAAASFDGTTCAEIENTVLTGSKVGDFCHVSIEAGTVDGVPLPSITVIGNAPPNEWTFVPDYNGEGDSLVILTPPGDTFWVMFTSAGPAPAP